MADAAAGLLSALRVYLAARDEAIIRDFLAGIDWDMAQRALEPQPIACMDHLDRAGGLAPGPERTLALLLARDRHRLRWGQTYTAADFGRHFIDNYGWVELFGMRGHFVNDRMAAGFLILGPGIVYPDHHHLAEELYVPLTGGTEWRKGLEAFVGREAGEIIHHRSNVDHAMRTGAEPLLALYLWRGGPLAQRSIIAGTAAGR